MHPALSIVFFTVTAGAGYGLVVVTALVSAGIGGAQLQNGDILLSAAAGLVAVTLGLCASSLHLANPKNAWRAFSRFRTSWLSREAVLAVAFYPIALVWFVSVWLDWGAGVVAVFAFLTMILALATVFSTAMIYACLRTIPQWHTSLTPANYILLSLMIGFLGFSSVLAFGDGASGALLWSTLLSVAVAFIGKLIYYLKFSAPSGPSIATATGFKHATVRLLDVGHSAGTFLTDEFGFTVFRGALMILRILTLILAFVVPAVAVWLVIDGSGLAIVFPIALVAAYVGLLMERWLFFAEARHVVNLYHGTQRV
ncbi:MAG: dimethyl sulfoxide reductase anchor subunit [Gammaproteobacteria bacterium]|nr:dimethyl sulfoxide reductase anchor subunit [Gammaproteobacteria bacterium]MDH3411727.1 dimethyl sulfoxide reductase anchor subunit [Gammaproteobacteria bacterium]